MCVFELMSVIKRERRSDDAERKPREIERDSERNEERHRKKRKKLPRDEERSGSRNENENEAHERTFLVEADYRSLRNRSCLVLSTHTGNRSLLSHRSFYSICSIKVLYLYLHTLPREREQEEVSNFNSKRLQVSPLLHVKHQTNYTHFEEGHIQCPTSLQVSLFSEKELLAKKNREGGQKFPFARFSFALSTTLPRKSIDTSESQVGPDLSPHKSILDSYTPRYPGSLPNSPSTFHHFPPLLRSYQGFSMATSYSGGDGDSLVVAPQPTDPVNSSASLHQLETTPSISSHPSRPTSPLLDNSTSFYTSYDASQTIPAPSEPSHPRSHSAEELISSYPSHTPELDQTSRASSINYSKTIKVVQWTPQRGDAGTQVTIILDSSVIRLAQPTLQNSSAPPFFGPGSNSSPDTPINRTFSVLFGQAPAPTDFTRAQAIDGNGVGQSMNAGPNSEDAFVVLTTFTPSRQAMGPVGEPVLVIVQVLDENAGVVESTIVGTWDVGAARESPTCHLPYDLSDVVSFSCYTFTIERSEEIWR